MGNITAINPQWRDWIIENIERDVPLTTLIEEMVKHDFYLFFATNPVVQLAADPSASTANNASSAVSSSATVLDTKPQFKFPIPAGYEQHYENYRYDDSHIA